MEIIGGPVIPSLGWLAGVLGAMLLLYLAGRVASLEAQSEDAVPVLSGDNLKREMHSLIHYTKGLSTNLQVTSGLGMLVCDNVIVDAVNLTDRMDKDFNTQATMVKVSFWGDCLTLHVAMTIQQGLLLNKGDRVRVVALVKDFSSHTVCADLVSMVIHRSGQRITTTVGSIQEVLKEAYQNH